MSVSAGATSFAGDGAFESDILALVYGFCDIDVQHISCILGRKYESICWQNTIKRSEYLYGVTSFWYSCHHHTSQTSRSGMTCDISFRLNHICK